MQQPFDMPDAAGNPMAVLVAASLVGFFIVEDRIGRPIEPRSIGSGTLVRMPGDVHGVLTAAHVLDEMPREGRIGYLTFTRPNTFQHGKIDIRLTEKVYAHGREPGLIMPDLGFLRVQDTDALSTLRARGCSFYDLDREREIRGMTSENLAWDHYVAGVVAESKLVVPGNETSPKRTGFTAMTGRCSNASMMTVNGFAITNVLVETDRHPTTYGGVSGGGLWVIAAPDGEVGNLQRFLEGVIFFQSDAGPGGSRIIRAHTIEDVDRLLTSQFRT